MASFSYSARSGGAGGSAPSIGGSITSGTTGSVLFVGSGAVIAQNNSNFFWDDTKKHLLIQSAASRTGVVAGDGATVASALGFGTTSTLTVDGFTAIQNTGFNATFQAIGSTASPPTFLGVGYEGSTATPTAVSANDQLLLLQSAGYDGTSTIATALVDFFIDGSVSAGTVPTAIRFWGSNGGTPLEVFRVSSNGTARLPQLATAGVLHNAVTTGLITSSLIVNADVSASAAIAYSKLALTGAILNADLAGSIAYSKLSLTGAILNADLAGSIAYSKLSLTGAILNADLAGSIAYSKLSLTGAILNADLAGSIAYSKLASLATGHIIAGNAGTPTDTTVSGDITIGATGVTAIGALKVTNAMIAANTIDVTAKLTGVLPAAQFPALTGDVTTSATSLATTLAATSNATIASLDKSTGVAIHGTNTNNSSSAGYVGEYVESVVGSTSFPATGTYGDLTSISLTAGDWDVTAVGYSFLNGATMTTGLIEFGISTTTGNSGTGLVTGSNDVSGAPPTSNNDVSLSIPNYRMSLSGTTTVYFKMKASYSAGTPKAFGRISARRER